MPFYRYIRHADRRLTLVPTPPPGYTSALLEVEKDRIEGAEMKRRLLHEPGAFLRKFTIQAATFWYIVETRSRSLLVGAIALVILVLSAIGAANAQRSGMVVWPVLLVIVYFNAMYAAFLAMARYSMPLFPTLSVVAAGGVVWLLRQAYARFGSTASEVETAGQLRPGARAQVTAALSRSRGTAL
jgi:hypothetical protein